MTKQKRAHRSKPGPKPKPVAERFWPKVKKGDGCWLWTGGTVGKGYGKFEQTTAHRIAYELSRGLIPDGLHVLHTCDNPICCHPDHLFLGTNLDNIQDRIDKGRSCRGEDNHFSKLSEQDVRRVHELRKAGLNQYKIASEVGASQATVSRILRKKIWRHVA